MITTDGPDVTGGAKIVGFSFSATKPSAPFVVMLCAPGWLDRLTLKMLDLSRISPEVVIYEEMVFDEATKKECRTYLENHGYSCQSLERDVIAVREPVK